MARNANSRPANSSYSTELDMDQQAKVEEALCRITEDFSNDGSEEGMVNAVAKRLTSDVDVDKYILRAVREMWILHNDSKPTNGEQVEPRERSAADAPAPAEETPEQ